MSIQAHAPITRRGFLAATCTAAILSRRGIAQEGISWIGMPLPLFPLAMVAFPGEFVPLHIFEPRYKQLLNDCRDDGITFGISTYLEGRISSHGTEMRLAKVLRENDEGEMDVVVEGLRVYQSLNNRAKLAGKPYPGALVIFRENDPASDEAEEAALLSWYRKLYRVWNREFLPIDKNKSVAFQLGHAVGLTLPQKVKLLKEPSEAARQKLLRDHIAQLLQRHRGGASLA